jgi:hypothetical protein
MDDCIAKKWMFAMRLNEILESCNHLETFEKRCMTDDFVDVVFNNEDLSEWYRILSTHLGEPRKPKGKTPNAKDLKLTSKTGGIRVDQTLFEKEFEGDTVIAKFWPWQDDRHTTLRMALLVKG